MKYIQRLVFIHPNPIAPSRQAAKQRRKAFTNHDLPDGTLKDWHRKLIPHLRDHAGILEDPWATTDLLGPIQILWDDIFPNVPHKVGLTRDPVYAVVSCQSTCLVNQLIIPIKRQCNV